MKPARGKLFDQAERVAGPATEGGTGADGSVEATATLAVSRLEALVEPSHGARLSADWRNTCPQARGRRVSARRGRRAASRDGTEDPLPTGA